MTFDHGERFRVDFANPLAIGSRAGDIQGEKQVVCTKKDTGWGKRDGEEQADSWEPGSPW